MPKASPPTCTTVRACTATPTHHVTASSKIRGLPARAGGSPVDLYACEKHLPIARGLIQNRETKSVTELPTVQPGLFDN